MKDIPTDEDLSQEQREELIADYQRIVNAVGLGQAKVEKGAIKYAQR